MFLAAFVFAVFAYGVELAPAPLRFADLTLAIQTIEEAMTESPVLQLY